MQDDEKYKIEKVVKQIKSGDKYLIEELYSLIAIPIRHIAYKYLHNKFESEELVQDFWADIYVILNSYRYNKNAYGYLCKVIRNRAIDRFRKLHNNAVAFIDYVDYGNQILSVDEVELHLMIDQAISNLPKSQAIIIQSIYFERNTIREIAKELKMSKSEVFR